MKYHKHLLPVLALGSTALLFSACSEKQKTEMKDTVADAKEATAEAWQDTKSATAETWNDLADATYAQRESFKDGMSNMAEAIDDKTDALAAKSDEVSDEMADEWNDGMDNLREARSELADSLEDLGERGLHGVGVIVHREHSIDPGQLQHLGVEFSREQLTVEFL